MTVVGQVCDYCLRQGLSENKIIHIHKVETVKVRTCTCLSTATEPHAITNHMGGEQLYNASTRIVHAATVGK